MAILALVPVAGYSQGFNSVHSPNGYEVWAVGTGGNVFRSYDGGVTWGSYPQEPVALRGVYTLGTRVWVVGDGGKFSFSPNSGTSWTSQVLNGGSPLNAVTFRNQTTGWIVGNGGLVLKTTDGGSNWSVMVSGTTDHLYSVAFRDTMTGFVGGASGTLLKTTDGGESWTDVSDTSWTRDFSGVGISGVTVYAVGQYATGFKSTNEGSTWATLNLRTDSRSDVEGVCVVSEDRVYFIGGGGYIRSSQDGGQTFEYGVHQMHARLRSIYFYDNLRGWACSDKNNAVLRTTDGGATWLLPQGTTVSYSWTQRLSASNSTGNTFCINPWDKEKIYVALSNTIYMSANRGDTWIPTATISGSSSSRSFYISPRDTNLWVVAHQGAIKRSTNRGVTWTTTIARNYTSYGMPLEMNPDYPDTLIFAPDGTSGPNGIVYESTDFGLTWDTLAQTSFRSPCDIVIVPGKSSTMYVGDGVTGSGQAQMWRSADGGRSWTSIYTVTGSEIPMISIGRLRNSFAYATAWGSGGFWKTTTFGENWSAIASTGSTWGTDVAKDDPNVVLYGVYGGGTSYLSTNAGASFTASPLSGSNSAMLCYDRGTFLAQQTSGVSKYTITYTVPTNNTQALTVVSPNGGENWGYGTLRNITWNASNVSQVRIEYQTDPANPWQTIVENTTAGAGLYSWIVPNTPTSQARVRIGNAFGATPVDSSNGFFSITASGISVLPGALDFGQVAVGAPSRDTLVISNTGTTTLVVSNVTTNSPYFIPGRTSFTIPASSTDTLSVTFSPAAVQLYNDTLRIASNAPSTPFIVPLSGSGTSSVSVGGGEELPTAFALEQNYPNPFNPTTLISYALPQESFVTLTVYNNLGQVVSTLIREQQRAGRYTVPFSTNNDGVSTGMYFYRLQAGTYVETRKMILIK